MPMSPRLLRPRASGPTHPEAKDWVSRVVANGGTVGSSTAAAVDKFCRDIDATSGLRAAILRLNLFCGNNLEACLIPLYRAASLGGSVLGNTTDTNNNFVSGDFQETGSGGGLKGNGTTKYLATGFNYNSLASALSTHLSASGTSMETSGDTMLAGCFLFPGDTAGLPQLFTLDANSGASGRGFRSSGIGTAFYGSAGSSESHLIGTRTSSTLATAYRAGVSAATGTASATPATAARQIIVFGAMNGTTVQNFTAARLRMYSIGNGLTAAQALAFSNAVIAFNTALGRA